jgi:hypothetical protein
MEKYSVRVEIGEYVGMVLGGLDEGGRVAEMAMMVRPADTVDAPACMRDYLNYVQVMSALVDQMADWGTHVGDALQIVTARANNGDEIVVDHVAQALLDASGIMPEVARAVVQYVIDEYCRPVVTTYELTPEGA